MKKNKKGNSVYPEHINRLLEFKKSLSSYGDFCISSRAQTCGQRMPLLRKYLISLKNFIRKIMLNEVTFIGLMFFVTGVFIFLRLKRASFTTGNIYYELWWVTAFCYLTFNVAYMLICSLYARFTKDTVLKESYGNTLPRTAIIYTIRGESTGLYERINYTFSCNCFENNDLWILSGDTEEKYLRYEESVIKRLREKFGRHRVFYLHSTNPKNKKREMIDIWVERYGIPYKYFIICDADSFLPEESVNQLVRKAEHKENADISIFQAALYVVNAKTIYSQRQATSIVATMSLYTRVQQNVFGQVLYFGHNALVRTEDFRKTSIPDWALSHDIWETVSLGQMGKKVYFCNDVATYEEAPTNYLEDMKRIKRWAKGNLQTWRLLFAKNISLGLRFLVIYGVYSYTTQLVFLLWFLSGMGMATNAIWQKFAGFTIKRYFLMLITLCIVFFHKMIIMRGFEQVKETFRDIVFTTVMGLNNIFYVSTGILSIPFQKLEWKPMKKKPSSSVTLKKSAQLMWPTTLVGIYGLYMGYTRAPYWCILALPILISFTSGILVTYWTAIPLGNNKSVLKKLKEILDANSKRDGREP